MLVLSRKTDQSIRIAGNILIRVLRINGNQVRLGIEAPEHVRVLRHELSQWSLNLNDEAVPQSKVQVRSGSSD